MYKKLSFDKMKKVENILLDPAMTGDVIEFNFPKLNASIKIDDITMVEQVSDTRHYSSFTYDNSLETLEIGGKKYSLNLETWRRFTQKNELSINISLSTDYEESGIKFGQYFYQIELADCLEDDDYIYIVRDVTSFVNYGSSYEVKLLGSEIVQYRDKHLLLIDKLRKRDLDNPEKKPELMTSFIKNLIRCAFVWESFK